MPLFTALTLFLACDQGFVDPSREYGPPVPDAPAKVSRVHVPTSLGAVDTPRRDIHGAPIGVSCATCHAGPGEDAIVVGDEGNPEQMHGTIELLHGGLACDACHEPTDRRLLHLADGAKLEMAEAMKLCAQCHGPQARDYQKGAHGGMTGYWDLRQGERVRNHCVECHAPHSPKPPQVQPAPRAVDRVVFPASETH